MPRPRCRCSAASPPAPPRSPLRRRVPFASSPARRCRRAPTPFSCRRMSAATATRSACRRSEARRERAGGRDDIATRRLRHPRRTAPASAGSGAGRRTGHERIAVRTRLRVALSPPATKLTEPGQPLAAGAIHDSNRVMLTALLGRFGVTVTDLGILRDEPVGLAARLADAARDHDLILTSGGVSTGEEDHVKTAVEASGSLMFWRLAIKPGRPLALGVVAGTPFVGLAGNPGAVYVTLLFVVRHCWRISAERRTFRSSASRCGQPLPTGRRRAPRIRPRLRGPRRRCGAGGLEVPARGRRCPLLPHRERRPLVELGDAVTAVSRATS